jgi:thiamine transporter ThiT
MGKISSFFLGLMAGLLTGLVIAAIVFVCSTRWTVTQSAAFCTASIPHHYA